MGKKIGITETVLRDAQQSLVATRMTTDDMLPILETIDMVGYHSIEAWGGATFDAALRFLNEDPWERLRKIRARVRNTKLQMLFRGQNILGYKHYADDVVEYFVQKSIANGIDIIRLFDALNDLRNLEVAMRATKKEGGHAQGTICYTISPVHNLDQFVRDAVRLAEMGADSICIKDMAGLLLPYVAYDLVKAIKESVTIPVVVHTHNTGGTGNLAYLKAIEAGADVVDTAISPLANGTSQPPTESMVASLRGTPYDTGLDLKKLNEISDYFKPIRDRYIKNGMMDIKMMGVDINTLIYQVPGGMLSNLVSQLRQAGQEEKYQDVLAEVPRVRKEFGYPPLVTPTSQIVGIQAAMNIIAGERYKMITKESRELMKGNYGKTPAPVDEEVRHRILGDEEPITVRPADLLKPELESIRNEMKEYLEQEEDILSYALFPAVALEFFKQRRTAKYGIDKDLVDMEQMTHPI